MVEFSSVAELDLSDYRPINTQNAYGTLGLITVNGDVFLVVVSAASKVATVRPGETVQRIGGVAFCEYHSYFGVRTMCQVKKRGLEGSKC